MKKKKWIKLNLKNKFTILTKKKKLRSRSWFKIYEIQKKIKLIKKNDNVIDLGSSPGSWSKFIRKKIGINGKIFSCDIITMKKIKNVIFIKGDICKKKTKKKIINITKNDKINLITSDISPNISGIKEIDYPKFKNIINHIINLCKKKLINKGNLLIKIFLGKNFSYILKKIKNMFKHIKIYKPQSSYTFSKETYIIALNYNKINY